MRRLRLNLPLALAILLLLGLGLLLLLPMMMAVPDPHMGVLVIMDGAKLRVPGYKPGEFGYLLGSDLAGRDIFGRIVYGARFTLGMALAINLVRALVAIPLGLFAGWQGGRLGRAVQALATGVGSIPTLIMVAICLGSLRPLVLGDLGWLLVYGLVVVVAGIPRMAEHVRRRAEEVALLPHIEAAVSLGAVPRRLIFRHILPVMWPDLLVMLATEMAWVLLMMAQLAIFGIFVGGTVPVIREGYAPRFVEWAAEWGQMLGANRYNFRSQPWMGLYPGLALGLTAMAFHLLAEGLRLRGMRR